MQGNYCIWCGTSYAPPVAKCPHCGKNPDAKENLLVDYLIAHTKDSLKSKGETSLFTAIKNWLLSHLYGVVLTITVVAALSNTVFSAGGHIQQVSSFPALSGQVQSENPNSSSATQTPESEEPVDMREIIENLVESYIDAVNENDTAAMGQYVLPASYGIDGYFHVYEDRWGLNGHYDVSAVVAAKSQRNISTITDQPRRVYAALENLGYQPYFVTGTNYMYETSDTNGAAALSAEYHMTVVEIDGVWYIAEALNFEEERDLFYSEQLEGDYIDYFTT